MQVDRSTVRYRLKRPGDSELREEIRLVAKERRRFGYRRIQMTLERKGIFYEYYPAGDWTNHREGTKS